MTDCVFCDIIAGRAPAQVAYDWHDTIAVVPLNPVTPGHLLVIPHRHVDDASEVPAVTGRTVECAAELAGAWYKQYNLITSVGPYAMQTVFHLHIHIVPRTEHDGLNLPWTGQ